MQILFFLIFLYSLYKGVYAKNEYNAFEMFLYFIISGASFLLALIS